MSIEIPLSQGKFATVDEADHEWLSQWRWSAMYSCGIWYAVRTQYLPGSTKTHPKRKTILMHRQILGLGHADKHQADHINHDGLDNRRENLRTCSNAENHFNLRKSKTHIGSHFKGVGWKSDRCKWRSRIKIGGKDIHLGYFSSEIDAAQAYDEAALKYFGEFACTNGSFRGKAVG